MAASCTSARVAVVTGLPVMPKHLSELPEARVATAVPQIDGWLDGLCAVHSEQVCEGPCPFHNPSGHALSSKPWRKMPTWWGTAVVRICEHDRQHVDPDSLAWLMATMPPETREQMAHQPHRDCCSCCPYSEGYE